MFINYMLTAINTFFTIYIIMKFYENFFLQKENNKLLFANIIINFVFLYFFCFIYKGYLYEFFAIAISVMLISFNYQGELKRKILFIACIIMILSSIHIATIFSMQSGDLNNTYFIESTRIMSSVLEYILTLIIGTSKRIQKKIKIPILYWFVILYMPIGSFYLIIKIFTRMFVSKIEFTIIVFVIVGFNIGIIYLYDALNNIYDKHLNEQILNEQNLYYRKQLKIMSDSYDTIRSVKHDIKNCLNTIENLTITNQKDKVIDFIDNVNHSSGFNVKTIDSQNTVIDGILNYKIQEAKNNGVNVDCRVLIPQNLEIDPFDLTTVLGNLIDNAVNAVKKIDDCNLWEEKVKVSITYTRGTLIISIVNPFEGEIKTSNGRIVSDHKDKINHGYGLKNVGRVIKKYHGEIEIKTDENMFTVRVILYI